MRQQRTTVAQWGRLAVVLALAAGFLTMHGFLAVSASSEAQASLSHHAVGTQHEPSPVDHHDVVAGCVVALVGIGLVGLALLARRRPALVEPLRTLVRDLVRPPGPAASGWSPPRVALCVIRV